MKPSVILSLSAVIAMATSCKSWIWEGNIDGKYVKVNCPELVWEK